MFSILNKIHLKLLLLIIFFYGLNCIQAQTDSLFTIEKFKAYTEAPREITYAHLNKSILLRGEMLGFSVYTLLKDSKTISKQTNTIYCTISDKDNNVIKKKMLLTDRGVAHNTFNIDSLFTSGDYIFRAYTNWMLNFDEKNYFESSISVIDPEIEPQMNLSKTKDTIDLQVLPEGGHLIESCQNFIAIIAKDQNGCGIPNLEGKIVNDKDEVVGAFVLNQFGIGKTVFTPTPNDNFSIKIKTALYSINQQIENIDKIGFNISVLERLDKITLSFKTNQQSLNIFKDDPFKIVIHNGKDLSMFHFSFKGELNVYRVFEKASLFKGVNIITVFDKNNNPLLERLFFNYHEIPIASPTTVSKKIINDSIQLKWSFDKAIDTTLLSKISISILPSSTKSYNFNSSIISKTYLEPYINSPIENASYYFTDISAKTKYDLDNLLISQGWSSYNWNSIFNSPPVITNDFNKGISATVHLNNKNTSGVYMTFPLENNKSQIFELGSTNKTFTQTQLFPLEEEQYQIVKSNENSKGEKPNLYVQFSPSQFPYLNTKNTINFTNLQISTPYNLQSIDPSWEENVVELDEVVIKANVEQERLEKLRNRYFGNVDLLNESIRRQNLTFAAYINTKGFIAQESFGTLTIRPRVPTSTSTEPLIFLDDSPLNDFSVLYQFSMALVDYIVVNSSGFGEGVRGGAGVIRIFTNPQNSYTRSNKKVVASVPFPLTYAVEKKFYVPKYTSYSSRTFREYGAIDWIPNITPSSDGKISLKLKDTQQSGIAIYIEGILNENTLVSKNIIVSID